MLAHCSPLTVCGHKVCLLYIDMWYCINSGSGFKNKKGGILTTVKVFITEIKANGKCI